MRRNPSQDLTQFEFFDLKKNFQRNGAIEHFSKDYPIERTPNVSKRFLKNFSMSSTRWNQRAFEESLHRRDEIEEILCATVRVEKPRGPSKKTRSIRETEEATRCHPKLEWIKSDWTRSQRRWCVAHQTIHGVQQGRPLSEKIIRRHYSITI